MNECRYCDSRLQVCQDHDKKYMFNVSDDYGFWCIKGDICVGCADIECIDRICLKCKFKDAFSNNILCRFCANPDLDLDKCYSFYICGCCSYIRVTAYCNICEPIIDQIPLPDVLKLIILSY